jgi:hypothetical protein
MRATARLLLAAPGVRARAAAVAAKGAAAAAASDAGGPSKEVLLRMARPVLAPPPHSAAERARRRANMQAYGRLQRADFLAGEAKARRFLVSKWSAIDALPSHARRVEALQGVRRDGSVMEMRRVPQNAPIWTHTPPIPGFNVGDLTKK